VPAVEEPSQAIAADETDDGEQGATLQLSLVDTRAETNTGMLFSLLDSRKSL
jgi:hypothetical protein